ncbi:UNVERIFIED_CONTAM: hypothetical protein FKN15_047181 [Acipenser sinensis]
MRSKIGNKCVPRWCLFITKGTPGEYAATLVRKLHSSFKTVNENSDIAWANQKLYYDWNMRHKPQGFCVD